ncbi:MAG TPA: DUF5658 family protein [Planctomycetota bacterium]|nr:DUF5658 family protein [Planctomycetota bacterium]
MDAAGMPIESPLEPREGATEGLRGPDRRRLPTPRLSRFSFLGGRRRRARRGGEGRNSFVDRYDLSVWALLLWVALMNAADCFFTLLHLQNGAVEVNPFAVWMLSTGRLGFVALKSVLITLPLVVLCLHKNFALARVGLGLAAGTYTLLCAYHIWLL